MATPAADSGGEYIIICIDNAIRKEEYYHAQLEAIRSYATYKIQSHSSTVVGLLTMSGAPINLPFITVLLEPTRDLQKIFNSLRRIVRGGELDLIGTISQVKFDFENPENIQKRMVIFAGSYIDIHVDKVHNYAKTLRNMDMAVDVVNFTLGDILDSRKRKLEALVATVNNDSSRIIHVEDGSSLSNLLSSFMVGDEHVGAEGMKNKDKTSIKKKKAKNVDVYKQPSSSYMAKGMKNKDHLLIHSNSSRQATEAQNVDFLKLELEPSSKRTADHEDIKNSPFKLQNRFEAFSISTESKERSWPRRKF